MNTGLRHCPLALALPCYSSLELLIPTNTLIPTPAQWAWQWQDSHCAGKSLAAANHREAAAIHSALVSSTITGLKHYKGKKTKTKPASIKSLYGTKARLLIMF